MLMNKTFMSWLLVALAAMNCAVDAVRINKAQRVVHQTVTGGIGSKISSKTAVKVQGVGGIGYGPPPLTNSPYDCNCCDLGNAQFVDWDPWYQYDPAQFCGAGYHLPVDSNCYDYQMATQCRSSYQVQGRRVYGNKRLQNGLFLLTQNKLRDCYGNAKCRKYSVVCIKDGCGASPPVSVLPVAQPNLPITAPLGVGVSVSGRGRRWNGVSVASNRWPALSYAENYDINRQCPSSYFYDPYDQYQYALVVDNSCGLSEDECRVQKQIIADLFNKIKVDDDSGFTKVAYIEYYDDGARTKIGFEDDRFQKNSEKYYNWIIDEASCGDGGNGKTDTVSGLAEAVNEFLEWKNGDPRFTNDYFYYFNTNEANMKRKIIMINNCENTNNDFDFFDNRWLRQSVNVNPRRAVTGIYRSLYNADPFDQILDIMTDKYYFQNAPDIQIWNVPPQDRPARNSIECPEDYLSSLVCDGDRYGYFDSYRRDYDDNKLVGQICVAPPYIANDAELTPADYTKAMTVAYGRNLNGYDNDKCLDDDVLCDIVGVDNEFGYYNKRGALPNFYRSPSSLVSYGSYGRSTRYDSNYYGIPDTVCLKIECDVQIGYQYDSTLRGVGRGLGLDDYFYPDDNLNCLKTEWILKQTSSGQVIQRGGYQGYECIPVARNDDYILTVNNGCGLFKYYVDGVPVGSYNYYNRRFSKAQYLSMDFPITCSKYLW